MSSDPRYPIGKFERRDSLSPAERRTCIETIAAVPQNLRNAVRGLSEKQLDTPYREGGWTLRQVVHHVPDSHMNAFIRFKLALTEPNPTIKPYDEKEWAKLADVQVPIETSLVLLEAVHHRWLAILRSMTPIQFEFKLKHPELGQLDLDRLLGMYAWHGKHHVAHIMSLRKRMGW